MTPAINLLKKSKHPYTLHEYHHDSACSSYGAEAAEKLNVLKSQVYKTLVITFNDKQLAVAVIPVSQKLNMKLAAKALNTKKVKMADATDVERSTGYVLGGVSPIGQKKKLITMIDSSVKNHTTIFVSAGRRGLELELSEQVLKQLTNAKIVPLS